jgi:hypothetical protein
MRPYKKDKNHNEIKKALIESGILVHDLYWVGKGIPDLLCSYLGFMFFVEVKAKWNSPKTKQQERFFNTGFGRHVWVVYEPKQITVIKEHYENRLCNPKQKG